ncbi:MAG TPA: PstS family phosphate ABC transporter substrate-binding protein [Vicinamibacteria bacterium]
MKRFVTVAVLAALAAPALAQQIQGDPARAASQKTSGVSGNINSVGSDTMNNMMTLWAEAFLKMYPNVKVQVEGKGSSTAPPSLIAGTAQFGPMSRAMRATEVDQFEAKYGYKPTQLRTSYDALAVYVNKDNPLDKLTLAQVDAAFSKTRRRGYKQNVTTWGQLGLTGDWANRPVSLYGRNSASGTYGFFKEHSLGNGDFKDSVKEQPGSASVVQGVTEDRFGMGYSGIGYKTSGVKVVALANKEGEPFSAGSYEDVKSGKYPLNRFLYIYINRAPGKPLDPLVREYAKFIFSKEGQEVVLKDGYLPLPAEIAKQELAKLE